MIYFFVLVFNFNLRGREKFVEHFETLLPLVICGTAWIIIRHEQRTETLRFFFVFFFVCTNLVLIDIIKMSEKIEFFLLNIINKKIILLKATSKAKKVKILGSIPLEIFIYS